MSITPEDVFEYHMRGRPGKIEVRPTKPLLTQRDLSLAYSPGVAETVLAIDADPSKAWDYTARGNLVAVITNGTAILGLGNRGPLPAKPVMEGKGVLFKVFADIDVFDIELDALTRRSSSRRYAPLPQRLAGSIWRISKRPNASISSAVCGNCAIFRSSTMISMAQRLSAVRHS